MHLTHVLDVPAELVAGSSDVRLRNLNLKTGSVPAMLGKVITGFQSMRGLTCMPWQALADKSASACSCLVG